MVTESGDIFLIECANRGGGCYTSSRIVPAVSGYDLSEYLILSALGERNLNVSEDAESMKKASVLSFLKFPVGKIVSIENQEKILKRNHTLAFHLSVKPGDLITAVTNDADRHGFVIASGETRELAKQHAEEAKRELVVQYDR
jgi:biotin carboxylase